MLRTLKTIIVMAALLAVISCGSGSRTIALRDVCGEPDNGKVRVEGYFRLPQVSDWIGDNDGAGVYRLLLVEKLTGGGTFVTATVAGTGSQEPNRMNALPASYTHDDVRINTASGRTVSAGERLLITGRVSKDSKPCILQVEKIDTL